MDTQTGFLSLYATGPYPCSYLPARIARSQVAIAHSGMDGLLYSHLVKQGFRRSGEMVYRPWCDQCSACVPVRIPVDSFVPSRSQRRAWQQHNVLQVAERPMLFNHEHFQLYQKYLSARHPGGGMDEDSPDNYEQFLLSSDVDTRLVEFSDDETVKMVSIIDVLEDGLSSVYTFFDPSKSTAGRPNSFGTFNIIWQIERCKALRLPYLYLGYWVENSQKMDYKQRFKPLEGLTRNRWEALTI